MYQNERIDKIIDILKENGYVTVKYLTQAPHYSNATISRDLKAMEKQKLIIRSYGGAALSEIKNVPLTFRYHKEKIAKRKISKRAAEFIADGDTVFIDGTTTSEGMGDYLSAKKDITVITNNMALGAHLSQNGVKVILTGGDIVEPPYMLGGTTAIQSLMYYRTDKAFFSSGGVSEDGFVTAGGQTFNLMYITALKNTKKAYYLIDHSKVNASDKYNICDFSQIDTVISDYRFPAETKSNYPNTAFCEV